MNEDFRPNAEFGRLHRKAGAFGEKQTGLGASLLGVETLQDLDLRIGCAGDLMGHGR
jgi:hypothetical protein